MRQLTDEQEEVVHHPRGSHARILAVAGSGKSTTLAHRIQHLIDTRQALPTAITVLMFNALARKEFSAHLDKTGLFSNLQPSVHTFHSLAFQIINESLKAYLIPSSTQFWLSDKTEYIWASLKRVISDLEKARRIPPEAVDPDTAMHAISLWKGSLIPPDRAGSYTQPLLPQVYVAFEQFRLSQHALTYDDFIPMAIDILEDNTALYRRFCQPLEHVIVDEYQDINLGQQTLIELLSGGQADVMVVGDDDQTIYEWRGARPSYIIQDFQRVFANKPALDYRLSHSFRFGPVIAQCAGNVIACNSNRVQKPLVAFQFEQEGFITVFNSNQDATKELADEVSALVGQDGVPATQIVVLARMYAQLDDLEAEFLTRQIPYRVDGQEPFYKRKEINALLDYIRLANALERPVNEQIGGWLLNVANKPSRMLSRAVLERLLVSARTYRQSLQEILNQAIQDPSLGLTRWQIRQISQLLCFLLLVSDRLNEPDASRVLGWMVEELDYLAYFQQYYGNGENAEDKSNAVRHFIQFVQTLKVSPLQLLEKLEQLDTTQGRPEEEQILFTTIFRTKGLEFDYVLIPQCDENLLPYLKGERMDIYDLQGIRKEANLSNAIENERRLFYVAITRARKGVFIGTSGLPSRFLQEIHLQPMPGVMMPISYVGERRV